MDASEQSQHQSRTCPGNTELSSGQAKSRVSEPTRVEVAPRSGTDNFLEDGQPTNRHDCLRGKQAVGGLLLKTIRKFGLWDGQPQDELEECVWLCISPTSFDTCGTGQIRTVQEHDNPNSTEMAMEVLIPKTPRDVDTSSHTVAMQA